jgi:purine nucleosidase
MNTKKIILDTDPGIDDALAILLALASPELDLLGITVTSGNCTARQGVVNALGVLKLAGHAHVPVFKGAEIPLIQPLLIAPETHGHTGLGYASIPESEYTVQDTHAVNYMIETVLEHPEEITIVAVGPLTNLALAIRMEPRFAPAIRELIIMGGAINHGGNTTPLAEFNVFCDPHAAHIVFHAGIPTTLVPLDVTYQTLLTRADVDSLSPDTSPVAAFIEQSTRFYMEFHDEYQKLPGCVINDPLALAVTFAPELVTLHPLYVDVDISGGVGLGKTYADFYRMLEKPANMQVALDVQAEDFIHMFLNRVRPLCRTASGCWNVES